MKKRLFLVIILAIALCVMLALTVSAEATTYGDAPARTNIQVLESDLIVFDDGFTTLSAYVVKDSTEFGWKQNAYDFSFINGKTGKTYTYDNIKELDIPQGVISIATSAFASNKNIVRVSFPDSVTTLGGTIFEYCSNLQKCSFEHNENSELETIPNWFLAHCTSLTAVSFPDCVKYVTGNTFIGGCTNLGAVYLPKNLISTEGGQNTNGTYGGCTNMYFVNEPFTYDNIPAKPDVYYFPAGYKSIAGEAFDTCKNLNKVLVFQADGITFDNAWTFEGVQNGEGGKPIIVFTGDVTRVSVGSWNVDKILFSNANDVDTTTAGVSGSKTLVFCAKESDVSKHLTSPKHSSVTPATCYSNKIELNKCFCGKTLSEGEVENTMLDHVYKTSNSCIVGAQCENFEHCGAELSPIAQEHAMSQTVIYAQGFTKSGVHSKFCTNENCTVEDKDIVLSPIFVAKGYSTNSEKTAINGGYTVNLDALEIYEGVNGNITYGIVIANAEKFDGKSFFDESNKVNTTKALQVEIDDEYSNFDCSINFGSTANSDLKLIICAYVIEGDNVTFIQADSGEAVDSSLVTGGSFKSVTLPYVVALVPAESKEN
ncbi:MAG: leucine-rich repeat domain-containing protein [Clostridia bacterium]|nr:leucine-rich repeat domain-containing protein [Clostridia bacterium]